MMTRHTRRSWLDRLLLAAVLVFPLAGCLSLEEDEPVSASVPAAAPGVVVSGSVGDGPVIGATITVYSNSGEVLATTVSDNSATFRSTLAVSANQCFMGGS